MGTPFEESRRQFSRRPRLFHPFAKAFDSFKLEFFVLMRLGTLYFDEGNET
jgi:hypothetical protein